MSNKLLLIKSIIWRFIATLITFLVSWGVSGNFNFGLAIGGIDATIKFVGYFLHEKAWDNYLNKEKDDENT